MRHLATAAVAAAVLLPAVAQAQQPRCVPRDRLLAMAADTYGEAPAVRMLDRKGAVVEIFANRESGTWTLVVTPPPGIVSCPFGHGEAFEILPVAAPVVPGSDS